MNVGEELFLFKRILLRSFTKVCLWSRSNNLEETTRNNQLWTKTNAVTYSERKREHFFDTVQLDYFLFHLFVQFMIPSPWVEGGKLPYEKARFARHLA